MTLFVRGLAGGYVRTLYQQEELRCCAIISCGSIRKAAYAASMLHDDNFIERYAAKCAEDGTVIVAYIENGVVRGAAELHPPDQSPDSLPEIAFSVEASVARQGVGINLFNATDLESAMEGLWRAADHHRRAESAMRALATNRRPLTFRHGESTGTIDLKPQSQLQHSQSSRSATPPMRPAR